MKVVPNLSPPRHVVYITVLLLPLVLMGADTQTRSAAAQEKARAQLRAAANSETELQRVEGAFPGTEEAALARLARGYLRLQARDYATAISLLGDPSLARMTRLGDYAAFYRAQALAGAARAEEAEREFKRVAETYPTSLLARDSTLQAAQAALSRGADQAAIDALAPLLKEDDGAALKLKADALERLGRTAEAVEALRKLYFDAPQSAEAGAVSDRLTALGSSTAVATAVQLRRRADRLYEAGLHVLAAQAYEQLARQFPDASGDEVWLRAGISHYRANSFTLALDALARVRARTPKDQAEALYYLGAAYRALRREAPMLETLGSLRRVAPASPRTAAMLYETGRYYERSNLPGQAATYYDQLARQFPAAANADEAHFWLAWRAHTAKEYQKSSQLLLEHLADHGEATDNRGRAAFWAAVDAERAGEKARALTLYRALLRRYSPGWYGVNSERRIAQLERAGVKAEVPAPGTELARAVANLRDNAPVVETIREADRERVAKAEELTLIALYQSAHNELEAAREGAPNSPLINLRIAQIWRARNENAAAINVLKRAYPDYGQALPEEMTREVWDIFYPLRYWPTIQQEAKRNAVDAYLVAGLIRQETIFNPQARSRANALGLMQLIPSTGRMVARRYSLGGGVVSAADLYNPVLNIQLGTAYLADMIGQFGRFEYAAAAYNGGPTRVARWLRELPAGEIEEWVDSIPLSETRLYVQGVYRNARHYQRLYDEQGRFKSLVPER